MTKLCTLCMIIKDEAAVLKRCLDSAKALVDEIIIVDTGSTDNSVQIAKDYGAQVFDFPWNDNFSEPRNYGLAKVTTPWILVLDADEVLLHEGPEHFQTLLTTTQSTGFFVELHHVYETKAASVPADDLVVRLFRNSPKFRFSGAIHEQVKDSIYQTVGVDSITPSPFKILHYGYKAEVIAQKQKLKRNLLVIRKALAQNPKDPFLLYSLGCEQLASTDFHTARNSFTQALALCTKATSYRCDLIIKLALTLLQLEAYPNLIKLAYQNLDCLTDSAELTFLLALALFKAECHKSAKAWFQQTLVLLENDQAFGQLNLGAYQVLQGLGECCEALGQQLEAFDYYMQVVELKPNYTYILKRLFQLWSKLKPELWEHWRPFHE